MRFVRTIRSELLIMIATAFVAVSISKLCQVAVIDGFAATLGAQALAAVQQELAWLQKLDRSMNIVGTALLLSGTFLPFVACSGSMQSARPSLRACALFAGAAGAAIYGLFHFPERIRVARESNSQLEPAITRYQTSEAAIGDIKDAAKPSWERRSNHKELSPSLAGAENRFLGLTFALRAVPISSLVNTARTQIWHPLVHEYAHE